MKLEIGLSDKEVSALIRACTYVSNMCYEYENDFSKDMSEQKMHYYKDLKESKDVMDKICCIVEDKILGMENKEDIIVRLQLLLKATRAGSNIVDMELNEGQDKVTIVFEGGKKEVNIAADSGIAIIKDVINSI